MSLRSRLVGAMSVVVSFALVSSVWAADVQGTYSGTVKCTYYGENGKVKDVDNIVLMVHQGEDAAEDDLLIDVNFLGLMVGKKFDDPTKLDKKAAGGAVLCGANSDPADLNAMMTFEIKKADKDKAKIKGTANITTPDIAGYCTYIATRSSMTHDFLLCDQ